MHLFKTYPVVVYTSFPKSGSKSIAKFLLNELGERSKLCVPKIHRGFGHNVIDKYKLPSVGRFFRPHLIYGHIPPTGYNVDLLDSVRTNAYLVSIRKLPDIVVSYKDHIDRHKSSFGAIDYRIPNLTEGVSNWKDLSNHQKYDFIIKFIIPWYVRFVAGWLDYSSYRDVKFILFEEVINDASNLKQMIEKLSLVRFEGDQTKSQLEQVNFNKGMEGRGKVELTKKNIHDIKMLMDFFPKLHESSIAQYLLS
jgi:hypothetical protein